MKNRRQREAQYRKNDIIEVAQHLFVENGIENVSMNDIAKASEFSKTTLYKYFKSKEELEISVYRKIHADKLVVLKEFIAKGETGPEKMTQFAVGYLKFWSEHPEALKIQLAWDYTGLDRSNMSEEMIAEIDGAYDEETPALNAMIDIGKKDGDFREDLNTGEVLEMYYLMLRSLLNQMLFIKRDESYSTMFIDAKNYYTSFVEIFINGLRPQP